MVKEQIRETGLHDAISHVNFTPFSSKKHRQTGMHSKTNRNLYLPDTNHRPCSFGLLDHRL